MIQLDHASTVKPSKEVIDFAISLLEIQGNPSSHHSVGEAAKQIISCARSSVARFINADESSIIFTPSGSASNTLATRLTKNCDLYYSPIAHKSILEAVKYVDSKCYKLKVNAVGEIDIKHMEDLLRCKCNTFNVPVVIIDYANSEIGTIQDVKSIIEIAHRYNGLCYLDCTGSISSIPLDVSNLDVDMAGFSGHKLGGLKGCGVFYKKPHINLLPLIYGSQEQGLIGGTENIIGIATLGKITELYNYSHISSHFRDYIWNYIRNNIPNSYLIGCDQNRLPHNLFLSFEGVSGETLMTLLDENGIQVSTGSACRSGDLAPSPTLIEIGLKEKDIHSCIRMTLNGNETMKELDSVCSALVKCVNTLRNFSN